MSYKKIISSLAILRPRSIFIILILTFGFQCTNSRIAEILNNSKNASLGIAMFIDIFNSSPGDLSTFGGESGADSFCKNQALAKGISHGNRDWAAFLSTATVSAKCRIQGISSTSCDTENLNRPIFAYRIGGTSPCDAGDGACSFKESVYVAANFEALLTEGLEATIANGADDFSVWSGTNSTGDTSGLNCLNWANNTVGQSGTKGQSGQVAAGAWYTNTTQTCDLSAHIACFQKITE